MASMIPAYRRFAALYAGEYQTKAEMEAAFARHIGAQFYFHMGEMEMVVWQRPSLEAMCALTGTGKYQLAHEILNGKWNPVMYPVNETKEAGQCVKDTIHTAAPATL